MSVTTKISTILDNIMHRYTYFKIMNVAGLGAVATGNGFPKSMARNGGLEITRSADRPVSISYSASSTLSLQAIAVPSSTQRSESVGLTLRPLPYRSFSAKNGAQNGLTRTTELSVPPRLVPRPPSSLLQDGIVPSLGRPRPVSRPPPTTGEPSGEVNNLPGSPLMLPVVSGLPSLTTNIDTAEDKGEVYLKAFDELVADMVETKL